MYFKSSLLLALLMLVSLAGYSQDYLWMRTHFTEHLFTRDSEYFIRESKTFIDQLKDGREKDEAQTLLDVFEMLNEDLSYQPFVCDFQWAMKEVDLRYQTVTLTPNLVLSKVQQNGHFAFVLQNNNKEKGFYSTFKGVSPRKQFVQYSRALGPYNCGRVGQIDYLYTFLKATPLELSYFPKPNCR